MSPYDLVASGVKLKPKQGHKSVLMIPVGHMFI